MSARSTHVYPVLLVAAVGAGCDDNPTDPAYDPDITATDFVAGVSNPLFPLVPGTTLAYESQSPDGEETIVVEVLSETRDVFGVAAVVVRDRVYVDGNLVEDTDDWFAQDQSGNVWYLGEDSKEIEDGTVVSTEGSWEWGVDGALPGIIMWADPGAHIGEEYRQEMNEGEAEDWGKVEAVDLNVEVPWGTFTGCIETEEWNALEPDAGRERKFYCPQVGLVLETAAGGGERVELVDVIGAAAVRVRQWRPLR